MRFEFETIRFCRQPGGVRGDFLRQFSFVMSDEDLASVGEYDVQEGALVFEGVSEKKRKRFDHVLENAMQRLVNRLTNKPVTYIHRNLGIPLIGSGAFGIIDRNTATIEVKPITGCNVACVFCSVTDEKRTADIVIEMEYLVQECEKLVAFKGTDCEIFINAHGEPTLYADLGLLIANLAKVPRIKKISMITNAMVLTPAKLDELVGAGLSQLNISINSVRPDKAKEIMGRTYHVAPVLRLIEHAVNKLPVVLAPVWVQSVNDEDIEEIIVLAKKYADAPFAPRVRVQNFLEYQFGSNPVKPRGWDEFYADLKRLEAKHAVQLVGDSDDFNFAPTKKLPKPFDKGDVVEAQFRCPGRLPGEMLAVARDRVISVVNSRFSQGMHKVKITRSKHNIFSAVSA